MKLNDIKILDQTYSSPGCLSRCINSDKITILDYRKCASKSPNTIFTIPGYDKKFVMSRPSLFLIDPLSLVSILSLCVSDKFLAYNYIDPTLYGSILQK